MNSAKKKIQKKMTYFSLTFFKSKLNLFVMKEKALRDYNEEIISKLKELNRILEKIVEDIKNGKKCSFTYSSRE